MKRNARVPKGEKYWYLAGNLKVKSTVEKDTIYDKSEWFNRNYFHTEEEANQMLKKLRAVLKGADVIEMPSGEELIAARKSSCPYPEDYGMMPRAFRQGWDDCFNWMNDKIVK